MKDLRDALNDIREARERMERLNNQTPTIIGNEALRVIDENFDIQGYDSGSGVSRWPERHESTNAAYDKGRITYKNGKKSKYRKGPNAQYKNSVFSSENPILIQTGNLRDSVAKKVTGHVVFIGVNLLKVPYAQIHNEGGKGLMFGKIPFKMPKRQFMPLPREGPNPKILKRAARKIQFEHDKIMKKFKK